MRRMFVLTVALGMVLAVVAVGPVSAGSRQAVTMTVTTTFDDNPDAFTATGLPGCSSGLVYDGGGHVQFTPGPGVFAGYKVFDCGSDNGFVVRLNARFGGGGSTGTWAVVDAWGSVAGMWGAGSLSGDPIENGIIDNYSGTVTF
jgi:hypothetical protein